MLCSFRALRRPAMQMVSNLSANELNTLVQNTSVLEACAAVNFPDVMAVALDRGADPNICDSNGNFPTLTGAAVDNDGCVKLLLDR
jgi:ankyrin repeat protein